MTDSARLSIKSLETADDFIRRHIGPNQQDIDAMLKFVEADSLNAFVDSVVPQSIRLQKSLDLPPAVNENQALSRLREIAKQNQCLRSCIGMGYYGTHVPGVIARNVLENPAWYTAYTPYQPEIAQGRLESIVNFQQLTLDLTGLDLASASLLDEATAAAEAMSLAKRVSKNKKSNTFFVDANCFPQTIDVVKTRGQALGLEVLVAEPEALTDLSVFGALFQYPGRDGRVDNLSPLIEHVHHQQGIVSVAADPLSLVLLKSPAEMGADIVFGSLQRFGVPMGFGGPHAAFFATHDKFKRSLPGRVIGVSKDSRGKTALRMAMQTREQHIRREKATSNICTAQVLLANMAAFYAVYHGPEGLKRIAERVHRLTSIFAQGLRERGIVISNETWFDTLTIKLGANTPKVFAAALAQGYNLRKVDDHHLALSFDETTEISDLLALWPCFDNAPVDVTDIDELDQQVSLGFPQDLVRSRTFLEHEVFHRYHSETEMLRYIKSLENRDFSLVHGMIPLGSCTMKLNASAEMTPVSWEAFANIHPFAPADQVKGYRLLISDLEQQLLTITGYDAISMQPNSGAQGEYAGLLAIKQYHESRGDTQRDICLIPSSAHGTNPASAQLAGMSVKVVACDKAGNVDLDDLTKKIEMVGDKLAALMVTYPSTHGVFEENIGQICQLVHDNGGQVYLDGANMNAQVGLTQPALIGADVSHLNLHKTFCIPHGGGGPGMGPIGVKKQLAPFLPGHSVVTIENEDKGTNADQGAVSAAPWGSASILPISWMYITMMGQQGLRYATEVALLNANYLAKALAPYYPILYSGRNGRVAHECIIDLRPIKAATGVSEVDIAKRLMDYGFHAPTMSFPVPGTFMIEPTESESKAELDRFIEAMIGIKKEIDAIEQNVIAYKDSPLHHAPHTLNDMADESWSRPYSKTLGAFPVANLKNNKFWPSVNRIDDVYGDRNFVCSCPPMSDYDES